jgi:hypothetical protein
MGRWTESPKRRERRKVTKEANPEGAEGEGEHLQPIDHG